MPRATAAYHSTRTRSTQIETARKTHVLTHARTRTRTHVFWRAHSEVMTSATISVNVRISTDDDVDGDAHRMQRSRNGKEAARAAATTITQTASK